MAQARAIRYQKERKFGQKINATFEFIRINFWPLVKSMLFIAGPFIVIGSIFIGNFFTQIFIMAASGESGPAGTDFNAAISMFVGIIGFLLFLLLGGSAIIAVVNNYMKVYEEKQTHQLELADIWPAVKKNFLMVFGTMCLLSLLVIILYVVVIVPLTLVLAAIPGLFILGIIAFYGAITYLSVIFTLVFFIRIYERKDLGSALSRAFYLIKGYWWKTFGLLFVMSLIHSSITTLFIIPWYANLILYIFHNAQSNIFEEPSLLFTITNYATLILYMLSNFIFYCIPLIALAFQYFNLVEIKEAKGLMESIDDIGTTSQQSDEETY